MTIQATLAKAFTLAIAKAFPESPQEAEVTQSRDPRFGDYQCNSAMRLGKMVGQNPRQVAEAIIAATDLNPLIEKLEVAGPGFINITLSTSFLTQQVNALARDERLGVAPIDTPQRVIVEYSSPNTAKEMHVGHLRSTVIGESLARLLEFSGHDVLRLNHVGDWGTQFGMLIAFMKEEAPEVLTGGSAADLGELVAFYKASKARFDADPDFKKRAQAEVVQLQGGNPDSRRAWELMCEVSRKAYDEIYRLLDAHIEERGESTYNALLPGIVADLEAKGLAVESAGAKCVFLPGFTNRDGEPLPQIVQKSDGGYNYSTTDLAAISQRTQEEKADWIIYVVDLGQKIHFDMVFETARRAGYVNPSTRLDHAAFGLVLGADGKKFRTRSGETEKLIDLIQAAVEHARRILVERNPDLSGEELDTLAHALGIGAIKYADLSTHRTGDYQFSYERMLSLEGNTAAYLLYSYVRVAGLKRKVGAEPPKDAQITLAHPSERALALHLARFPEALASAARELLPNRITDYLYHLANHFNAFFRDCRVQGDPQEASRLLLADATARTMARGLSLLAIPTVDRM